MTNDQSIRVGVITHPQGAHLKDYFGSLAQAQEVAKVTLADPTGETEALARQELGAKFMTAYRDTTAMLNDVKPELALVTMEAALAPPAIDAALDAGCHVLAEKPSCVRADDFAALVRKAESKHLEIMLAFANRLHAPVHEARRLMAADKFGKVYAVELHLIADQTRLKSPAYRQDWFAHKARAGGGQLIWLGIHWLDLALYITGLAVAEVAGFTTVVGGQPIDVEDAAAISLRFGNGGLGTFTSGYYLDKGYQSHIQIWGEHGWLRLAVFEEAPLEWYSNKDSAEAKVERFEYPKGERGYPPFVRACARFAAGLEGPPVTCKEGLHVLRTIFACYRAAETGQRQRVE
ncbi:MAG TPA: Gfo/Idh/MocA family oxidoreductase [Pirellulales bacterium]|nr:Gfo/Idh/MocA family oxidoreductase [Pirellulales bacterium]